MKRITAAIIFFAVVAILLALLCTFGHAQDLRITGVTGLQTGKGRLAIAIPPTDQPVTIGSLQAQNVDLTAGGDFTVSLRYGIDSVSHIAGQDSIVDIFSFETTDKKRYLVVVTDSTGVPYGNVYLTKAGSHCIQLDSLTRIATNWPIIERPSMAKRDDYLYLVNGVARGWVYGKGSGHSYPLAQPQSPTVLPLQKSGGVTGTVRYLVAYKRASYQQAILGLETGPITVTSKQIQLSDFNRLAGDTLTPWPDSVGGVTTTIIIYRTKGTAEPITSADTFFYCMSKASTTPSFVDTLRIVDSLTDAQLNSSPGSYPPLPVKDVEVAGMWNDTLRGRYGAPMFLGRVSGGHVYDSTTATVWGSAYGYSLYDPESEFEGPLSVTLGVEREGSLGTNKLAFPRRRSSDTGLWYKIYRAQVLVAGYDSVTVPKYEYDLYRVTPWGPRLIETYQGVFPSLCGEPSYYCVTRQVGTTTYAKADSFAVGPFRLLDSVYATDTLDVRYNDTMYQSVVDKNPFSVDPAIPEVLQRIVFFGNTMVGQYNSRVYYANAVNQSNLFQFSDVSPDDGDQITAIWPTRTTVRVTKQRSGYNLIGDFFEPELTDNKGCMAPRSVVHTAYGTYYLSQRGFELEGEGRYLERTFDASDVSTELENIRFQSVINRQNAVSIPIPEEHKIILQIGDTGFVFHEDIRAWTTWNTKIGSWALYDTGTSVVPVGLKLYAVRPGSSTLCKYHSNDSSYVDMTSRQVVIIDWRSAPLFLDRGWRWQATGLGIWVDNATTTNKLYARFVNETGVPVGQLDSRGYNMVFDSLTLGYRKMQKLHYPAQYYQLEVFNLPGQLVAPEGGTPPLYSTERKTSIRGFDIWARRCEQFR